MQTAVENWDRGGWSHSTRPFGLHEMLEFWLTRLDELPAFGPLQRCWAARSERSFLRLPELDGFEAWLVGWPAGTSAPLHDHGHATGAAATVLGCLSESLCGAADASWQERLWRPGQHAELARGVCHEVRNCGAQMAYSVHVYEPRLERMTFYARDARGALRPQRVELAGQW